ncbi:tetraacyldisaccharide 4'-kinase [Xylella fastidiosa]|uniref:tetraacyldisaccharide 4'-kinase n=1 Tax=Xylella fastidiosa TaxID=2371 RepID=UPI000765F19A|nr:tetraacyldisaccharide 4'-kinase [Xylella fastidiosa]ALR01885.1 tetraacyldisaccharide 4'-kinase [Xylella fastidiosa]KXB11691.1 tetraacyldisaccharide 4'-kinase [Xylella fastidiosa]KXB21159.1 tetraacyldisaccharide 4'-kinase [Xylella fastidiosa]MDG5822297.1 tetraacyldisaccharide 4'-kinase [Xylella fastidiosa subsp. pauca]MDG5825787.1 tetraacyldisaccharide 4'-kinase [Xylella fastidiosa subsp. pauca]
MSSGRGPRIPEYWYGQVPVPPFMRFMEVIYAGAVSLRRLAYRRGWRRRYGVAVPVVVIGNLVAGGTGKTPLTIEIVARLREAGWTPGIASRGYGRRDPKTPRWIQPDTPIELAGDEPAMIAWKTGMRVRVDVDRSAAARALVAEGCDIVVCDDGLQHYRLMRDIEIEVIDGQRRYGNGHLLPAGPLREPMVRGRVCDFRVLNAGQYSDRPTSGFGPGDWQMRLHIDHAQSLQGSRRRSLDAFSGQRVHAVAGIAHPERFFSMLRQRGIGVVPHAFPDHHFYRAEDFTFGSRLPVLMTEKDAVKCRAFADDWFFSVPLRVELPTVFWTALFDRLERLVSC